MDQYFQQMAKIVGEKKTSSRVRFMLQDVIDLRKVSEHYKIDLQKRSITKYCKTLKIWWLQILVVIICGPFGRFFQKQKEICVF